MAEVFSKVSDSRVVKTLLDSWVSTIYERRFLYVARPDHGSDICTILERSVGADTNKLAETWDLLDCLIENSPDAANHNTFVLICRRRHLDEIKQFLPDSGCHLPPVWDQGSAIN